MGLSSGTHLGPYEILGPIGSGGMGAVYRARDPRTGREVAVKVSSEQFSDRFSREIHAIAALNHPNICALYDVGPNYLVMELVEGENPEGPLPLEVVLKYARQIADALEAAHEKGIVHRDLKPGNIIVRPDGTLKVLDFGLAKMGGTPAVPSENSPTMTMNETQAGVILGTAAYMSPEQAKGKPVDRRADIWAFGVVLYEMLTGKRLFHGETTTEVLASVMKEEPRWDNVPPQIERLLRKCLEKDPQKRLKHIGDAMALVDEAKTVPAVQGGSRAGGRLGWIAAGVAAAAAGVLGFLYWRQPAPTASAVRFELQLPERASVDFFRLSPDGKMLAVTDARTRQISVRSLDSVEFRPLSGTSGARYLFWSPDSANIGFFADGKLKKVPATGGPVQILCDATNGRGGTWNNDGVIVFSPDPTAPIDRVSASGGVPVQITKISQDGEDHRFPEFLPDGHHFLFTLNTASQAAAGIYIGLLEGGAPVRILPDVSSMAYVPAAGRESTGGYILFRRGTTLMAVPFDSKKLQVTGEVFPLAQNVGITANITYAAFSASATGVLAHYLGRPAYRDLAWVDRKGARIKTLGPPQPFVNFALSPDEKTVAYVQSNGEFDSDIWMYDITRDAAQRFTFGPGGVRTPVWSADGSKLAYGSEKDDVAQGEIHVKSASGGKDEFVQSSGTLGTQLRLFDWSPDDSTLIYSPAVSLGKSRADLMLMPMQGEHKAAAYLQTPSTEAEAQFSPDGKWIAYMSDETGKPEIIVQPYPMTGAKWQVSPAGGTQPRWRRDGKELFYLSPQQKIMAVPVKIGANFEAGGPQELFGTELPDPSWSFNYAVSKDGQRFLLLLPAEDKSPPPPINIVLNWQAELKK